MRTLKTVIKTIVVLVVLGVVAGFGFIYSGAYNVAATDVHWPITRQLLHITVERSIAVHADNIQVPELGGREQLLSGVANFEAMCAGCHAPPGAEPSALAQGLSPRPPDMAHAAEHYSSAEIFWILKHGIKGSGMPAWGPTHSDEQLWTMVALVERMPEMTAADYQRLRADASAQGIGHQAGEASHAGDHRTTEAEADEPAVGGHTDDHGGGHHKH